MTFKQLVAAVHQTECDGRGCSTTRPEGQRPVGWARIQLTQYDGDAMGMVKVREEWLDLCPTCREKLHDLL